MLDNRPSSRPRVRTVGKLRKKNRDSMDAELERFIARLARSKKFDERQLFLPGLQPENTTP